MTEAAEPRNLFSAKPYGGSWRKYVEAQYIPIPVPRGTKKIVLKGFTGREGAIPSAIDYEGWNDNNGADNVALRLGQAFDADALNRYRAQAGMAPLPTQYRGQAVTAWRTVGLDVDNYEKGTGTKNGGEDLLSLEAELGALPPTAISTSRRLQWAAGELGKVNAPQVMPGIRLFLVPEGTLLNANIGPSIEAIQENRPKSIEAIQYHHRYMMTWPSEVDGRTYEWVWGATEPNGADYSASVSVLTEPYPMPLLPVLPEGWLAEGGGILRTTQLAQFESQLKPDQLGAWVTENLCPPIEPIVGDRDWTRGDRGMCRMIANAVDGYLKDLADDPDGNIADHDTMIAVTQRIAHLAVEGHHGWQRAQKEIVKGWMDHVGNAGKRSYEEAVTEFDRAWLGGISYAEAKATAEGRVVGKAAYEAGQGCVRYPNSKGDSTFGTCMTEQWHRERNTISIEGGERRWIVDPPQERGTDASRNVPYIYPTMPTDFEDDFYDPTDAGNANMLADIYDDNIRFVKRSDKDGFWISYSAARGGEIERNGSWYRMESDGNEISFPMLFGRCERIWKDYYSRMRGFARTAIDDAMQQAQAQGATRIPDEVKRIRERMGKLRSWLEYCQSATGMQRAEKLYQSWVTRSGMPVATTVREIDCNPMLMGCGEETLVLPSKAGERAYTRPMLKSDMITLNTGIRYVPWAELEQNDARGKTLLERHFDTVWPDKTMHAAVQARLGLIPIGGNPAKLALNAFGGRDTGKTTTGKMIAAALGKYAKNGSAHLLNNKVLNPRILHFEKARVVLISEPEGKVAAETLKMFTGNDTFDAEPKGSNEIRDDIMPMFTLLFMTNEPIQIENVDEATAGRIGVLPFQHRFIDGDDRDAHAVDNLPSEVAQAMLSWLVEGTNMYVAQGLPAHAAMDLIREQYVSGMNPYGRFVADVCEKAPAIMEAQVRAHHAERKPGNRGRTEVPTYIDWNAVAPEWLTDKTVLFEVFERWADANYGTGGKERMELTQYRLRQYLNGLGMQTVRDESTEERPKPNYYTGIRVVSDLKPRMRAR